MSKTMKQIKEEYGGFFFSEGAMKFFDSKVYDEVWETKRGTYLFITSEKSPVANSPRLFSIREYRPENDDIETVGEFQAYRSKHRATKAVLKMLEDEADE